MSSLRPIWALARATVRESLRRKDVWVVVILALLLLMGAGALGFFGADGLQTFIKDLAFTVLGLFSGILAVLASTRVVPEELGNRTIYPLLARPVSRLQFLVGKLLGAVFVAWIGFGLLALMTGVALASFHVKFEPVMAQYVMFKLMGLALVCTVSMTLSLYLTQAAAATLGMVLLFGGSMFSRGLGMAHASSDDWLKPLFKTVDALLPHFSLFDLGGRATYEGWGMVPLGIVGGVTAYFLVYGAGSVSAGWLKFRNQPL